jgi:hypothetical protein
MNLNFFNSHGNLDAKRRVNRDDDSAMYAYWSDPIVDGEIPTACELPSRVTRRFVRREPRFGASGITAR